MEPASPQRLYSLTPINTGSEKEPAAENDTADYPSCRYIEGGLSFTYSDIRACATRHHERGAPFLQDLRGRDPVMNLQTILESRESIREVNRNGGGHPECVGCPNLVHKTWVRSKFLFDWIAITNYIHCNLRCTFCWLTYAPHSPYNKEGKMPGQRFAVAPLVREIMEKQLLDPKGVVDWGGGGEPTLIPEFDELFDELCEYGVNQVLHTNAVKLPRSAVEGSLRAKKLRIVCSIDSGSRESYAIIKGRDQFETVFKNLTHYQKLGAIVHLKYIVQECNRSPEEIESFLLAAESAGFRNIVSDVDHRERILSPAIVEALCFLKKRAHELGMNCGFNGCGTHNADRALFRKLNLPAEKLSEKAA